MFINFKLFLQKPKKKLLDQNTRHNAYFRKLDRCKVGNKLSDKEVDKKIMLAKNIRKKAEAIARKDYQNNIASSSSLNKRISIVKTPQHKAMSKKVKGICKNGNTENRSRGVGLTGK